jgi:AcrR family transcriptional regulator
MATNLAPIGERCSGNGAAQAAVGTLVAMSGTDARVPLQREAIVDAARALIVADGLDALSLRRLARHLGVTAPALYAHLADKRDLLKAVAEIEFDALVRRFDEVADLPPLERIRANGHAYVAHARANPELFRVMFLFPPEIGPLDVEGAEPTPGATRAFGAAIEAVQDAIDAGLLATDDGLLAALTLWSSVHGVAEVLQLGFGLPPEMEQAMVDDVIERILAGYRSQPTA